jgi:hypothetical protein
MEIKYGRLVGIKKIKWIILKKRELNGMNLMNWD